MTPNPEGPVDVSLVLAAAERCDGMRVVGPPPFHMAAAASHADG